MIVSDLVFFDVSISEESDIRGGQYSYDSGGYYYVPKDKYQCYSYYNKKWGGTYYKCYQDKYIPEIPKKELDKGTLLS